MEQKSIPHWIYGLKPLNGGVFFSFLWLTIFSTCLWYIGTHYLQGSAFGFSFDDKPNLGGLSQVALGRQSPLEFVFGGNAGPTGRPVALLTFLLNQHSWPDSPADFIALNTQIHLINICLVAWLVLRLSILIPWMSGPAPWFALLVAVLWGAQPMLVSTSLMAVQRMTSLSATFSLAGAIVYVMFRQGRTASGLPALPILSATVVGFSILAGLSKESGFLLPMYILVIERTLIACQIASKATKYSRLPLWWESAFLWLPSACICVYALSPLLGDLSSYPGREFGPADRLLTQSTILMIYAKNIIAPDLFSIGPLRDGYSSAASVGDPSILVLSCIVWIFLVLACLRLIKSRYSVVCFGVFWFLVGHSLESTALSLELYFEHRNYLPSIGLIFVIAVAVLKTPLGCLWRVMIGCLWCMFTFYLMQRTTDIWANPQMAAKYWRLVDPRSIRALQVESQYVYAKDGVGELLKLMDSAPPELAKKAEFRIFKLSIYCQFGQPEQVEELASDVLRMMEKENPMVTFSAVLDMARFGLGPDNMPCAGLDTETYLAIMRSFTSERSRISRHGKAFAFRELGYAAFRGHDVVGTVTYMSKAFELQPSMTYVLPVLRALMGMQAFSEASDFMKDVRSRAPLRPFVRQEWLRTCDQLDSEILRQSGKAERDRDSAK